VFVSPLHSFETPGFVRERAGDGAAREPYERSEGGERPGRSAAARRPRESGSTGGGAGFQAEPARRRPTRGEATATPWLRHATQPWLDSGAIEREKAALAAGKASPGSGCRPKEVPIAISAAAQRASLAAGEVRVRRNMGLRISRNADSIPLPARETDDA